MKKFSPTRTITKANLDKVPADKPGVYRIKDAKDAVLLEKFKNKRNEYIHNLLSQDINNIEKGTKEIYEGNKLLLGDLIDKFEKKLKKVKK